jgi:hypothetical protein
VSVWRRSAVRKARRVTAAVFLLTAAACAPTIRVQVAPISIYAKLDADVRVKLDKEVQSLIQQNPNLF